MHWSSTLKQTDWKLTFIIKLDIVRLLTLDTGRLDGRRHAWRAAWLWAAAYCAQFESSLRCNEEKKQVTDCSVMMWWWGLKWETILFSLAFTFTVSLVCWWSILIGDRLGLWPIVSEIVDCDWMRLIRAMSFMILWFIWLYYILLIIVMVIVNHLSITLPIANYLFTMVWFLVAPPDEWIVWCCHFTLTINCIYFASLFIIFGKYAATLGTMGPCDCGLWM